MNIRNNSHNILVVAFVLLSIYIWVCINESRLGLPHIIKYILSISAFCIIIYYWIKNPGKPVVGLIMSFVLGVFLIWSLAILVSAIMKFNSLFYIQRVFGQYFFFLPYFIPLILLFSKFDLAFFRSLIKVTAPLLIPALIVQVYIGLLSLNRDDWLTQTSTIGLFDISISFLLLTSHLIYKKYISYLPILYYLIWLFLYLYFGRRGLIIQILLFFVYMLIIRLRSSSIRITVRFRIFIILASLIILLLPSLMNTFRSSYAFERGGISSEAFMGSRGRVIEDFVYDFNTFGGWIFGRGLDSTVYRSTSQDEELDIIENGYLTVILKGGLLYLIPLLIILLRAAYLGFFKSDNDISKALAILVFNQFIMMAYHGLPTFSTRYILLWIAISVSFSPEFRNITNNEVISVLND